MIKVCYNRLEFRRKVFSLSALSLSLPPFALFFFFRLFDPITSSAHILFISLRRLVPYFIYNVHNQIVSGESFIFFQSLIYCRRLNVVCLACRFALLYYINVYTYCVFACVPKIHHREFMSI